jgi:hypothetical protein
MTNGATARIKVLAATKMYDGICVAGLDEGNQWIRPVSRDGLNFTSRSLSSGGVVFVEPYNEVEFRTYRRLNNSPQSEDVEASSPKLIRTLSDGELSKLMARIDEHDSIARHADDLEEWLISQNRSLVLTSVNKPLNAYRSTFNQRRQRRITFRVGGGTLRLPCTDLRWRKLTRGEQDSAALQQLEAADELYFALGLARKWEGHFWPMVVGVHAFPRMVIKVDYDNL